MVDEELQNDDINFDDFNFDDLSEDHIEDTDLSDDTEISDFDLGDFSFDGGNFDNASEENIEDDSDRKEPFFEMSENDMADNNRQEPFFETPETVVNTQDGIISDILDDAVFDESSDIGVNEEAAVVNEDGSSFENSGFDIDEQVENVDENLSDDVGFDSEASIASDVSEETGEVQDSVQSIDDYLSSSDNVLAPEAIEENAETAVSDEAENIVSEEETESVFVDEIPEETSLNDDVSLSSQETDDEHEDYFGAATVAEESPLADVADEYGQDDAAYSMISSMDEGAVAEYLKWYSGHTGMKMFEISKGFENGTFEADEERKTLHVNVGYDTYGWEVQFSDGVVMNLRDVREYQKRNGRLPNPDGRIIYGRSSLLFSGVERIVVYESVRYFSYGA